MWILPSLVISLKCLLDGYLTHHVHHSKENNVTLKYYDLLDKVYYIVVICSSSSQFRERPFDQNKTVHNWILIEFCRYGCFVDSISTPTTANQNSIEKPWLISVRKHCNICAVRCWSFDFQSICHVCFHGVLLATKAAKLFQTSQFSLCIVY